MINISNLINISFVFLIDSEVDKQFLKRVGALGKFKNRKFKA